MTEPVRPEELFRDLDKSFPTAVIQAFNELLKENYRGKNNSIIIKVKDVINRITRIDESLTSSVLHEKKYLDVEELYRKYGWVVGFESPDRDESFDSYFEFKEKK